MNATWFKSTSILVMLFSITMFADDPSIAPPFKSTTPVRNIGPQNQKFSKARDIDSEDGEDEEITEPAVEPSKPASPAVIDALPTKPPELPTEPRHRRRADYGLVLSVSQDVGFGGSNGSQGAYFPARNSLGQLGSTSGGAYGSPYATNTYGSTPSYGSAQPTLSQNSSYGNYGFGRGIAGTSISTGSFDGIRDTAVSSDLYPWLYDSGPNGLGDAGDPNGFGGPLNSFSGGGGGGGGSFRGGGFGSSTSTNLTARGGYFLTDSFGISLGITDSIPEGTSYSTSSSSASGTSGGTTTGSSSAGPDQIVVMNAGASYRAYEWMRVSTNIMHIFSTDQVNGNQPGTGFQTGFAGPGGQFGGPNGYNPDSTIATLSTDFSLTNDLNWNFNFPYGFDNGILDPSTTFRGRYRLPISSAQKIILLGGVAATAPLSNLSQQQGKISTATVQANPVYHYNNFSFGVSDTYSYSFYNGSGNTTGTYFSPNSPDNPFGMPSGPSMGFGGAYSNSPQLYRNSGNVSLGYRFSREWRTTTSGGVTYTFNQDNSYSWGSRITVASLTYSPDDWTISANFSLASDPMNNISITFPSQPVVGVSLQYLFGERTALTGGAPGGLGAGHGGRGRD